MNLRKIYEGFYSLEDKEKRGLDEFAGGGICNICGQDVADGDFYANDLDSTREIILDCLCEEFGVPNNYSYEYEIQRAFGWDDDTWEESFDEIYSYLPDNSDYLCYDCIHKVCKDAVSQWHKDYFD